MSHAFANPLITLNRAISRAISPRKPLTVSQWSDAHRKLSSKGSAEPGQWRTDRNPPLREPMDCMSARSSVREVVLMFPIQFGKTEVEVNVLGYVMDHNPGPVMVCLPGEVSMNKWVNQKLNPMIEETPSVKEALTSVSSRDASNTRTFKDFAGGQLYLEHAGSPSRLKSTTVKFLLVDELDEFSANLGGGDDPLALLEGRTSAFPSTSKRMYISTPGIKGLSRTAEKYEKSTRERLYVSCPHCSHEQPLEWSGLQWSPGGKEAWYVCRDCGAHIQEHYKTEMIREACVNRRWVSENPDADGRIRGFTINCLYYQIGLGPRWADLAQMWLDAQNDLAKLKTFMNDRLAEPWEDPAMRAVKHNVIADRAEPYQLRIAPWGVLILTAGVDTQDNRLAVQIVGWGRGMAFWVLDYVELMGDPADDAVWDALTDLLNRPIGHASGSTLSIQATAIDAGGHRTEAVKHFVRSRRIKRPLCIFGAVPNNAPVLSKPKLQDVDWKGRSDKRGVTIQHVGTVGIKHHLFSQLSADADKEADKRIGHFSDELPPEYFPGLISETYHPGKNRFEKRRGARNEPLDTWVYAYAATHHAELRLHRKRGSDWDALEEKIGRRPTVIEGEYSVVTAPVTQDSPENHEPARKGPKVKRPAPTARRPGGFASNW
ncbi:MAG: phage terminase large subunit family protein [Formivibrio sp.]|nr:phage terminase large subunit family protein [Formivibrio sp.]